MKKTFLIISFILALCLLAFWFWSESSRKNTEPRVEEEVVNEFENKIFSFEDEAELIAIANSLEYVKILKEEVEDLGVVVEEYSNFFRVAYKDNADGTFLYGVDIDKVGGKVLEEGFLD